MVTLHNEIDQPGWTTCGTTPSTSETTYHQNVKDGYCSMSTERCDSWRKDYHIRKLTEKQDIDNHARNKKVP
jgi:hypothetical protein